MIVEFNGIRLERSSGEWHCGVGWLERAFRLLDQIYDAAFIGYHPDEGLDRLLFLRSVVGEGLTWLNPEEGAEFMDPEVAY